MVAQDEMQIEGKVLWDPRSWRLIATARIVIKNVIITPRFF